MLLIESSGKSKVNFAANCVAKTNETLVGDQSVIRKTDVVAANMLQTHRKLLESIRTSLSECPYRELRSIRVRIDLDTICLAGSLSSFYMKQIAQEMVRRLAPTFAIKNELLVSQQPVPNKSRPR